MRPRLLAVLVALTLVAAPVGPAVAQEYVRGQPDLNVYVPESDLAVGNTTQLTLQIANDGRLREGSADQRELVTTARGVTVEVTDDGPFDVSTGRQSIGSVPDGEVGEAPLTITVPEDVDPGEYTLRLRLRYTYTSTSAPGTNGHERTRTVRTAVDVVVDDGARFALSTVESDLQVGEHGTVNTKVTNVGNEPARDMTLTLESATSDVVLGENERNTARIAYLPPGESATVQFDAAVRPDVSVRNVTLAGSVRFTDPDGVEKRHTGLSTGLRPASEQEFTLTVEESTLRVGERGTVRGTITNDGPSPVENVVLSLGAVQLELRSRTYAVGDLEPQESASFRFRGTVAPGAAAVPQQFNVTATYQTTAGTDRSTTTDVRVTIAERRDAIEATPINATFAAGESGVLELEVTNRLDEPISDVHVHLVVEDPLTTDFQTTIIPRLQPGETDRVLFDLEVDENAPQSRFPARIEIAYTDADDEPATARPSAVAVDVTESDTGLPGTEIAVTLLVVLLVVAGGWWFYGRRLA